jgi:hypothetical protein
MSATVIVNMRTVVHKGSGGSAPGLPDFCKTPAPPGPPVPVPYPIVAQSSDTANGSTGVTCDGNPIMLKDSDFSRCTGDEAGTLKGVASSTNMGKAKFAAYSFDVKVENKNVPRLGDAMTNNGNSPNTTTVAELQSTTGLTGIDMTDEQVAKICTAFCECQADYAAGRISGSGCCSRCLEEKLKAMNDPTISTEQSAVVSRVGGSVITPTTIREAQQLAGQVTGATCGGALARLARYTAEMGLAAGKAVPNWMANAFIGALQSGLPNAPNMWMRRPDIVTSNPATGGGAVCDAKFTYKKDSAGNITTKDQWQRGQRSDYRRLNDGKPAVEINEETCKCS